MMHRLTIWAALSLLFACLLAGCGSQQTSQTPETVHATWVQALRDNDRTTLIELAADSEFKVSTVDGVLARMQDYIHKGYVAGGVEGGAFEGVDVLALEDGGQGKTGFSRWRFATVEICYAASLTPSAAGWKIVSWGQRLECPGA
jgi:hypothetical protein